ncbi:MAG: 4Fe-4S dicluster domain-containing protein [Desulfovibrio sp.]|jgi:ferredoxin-type protein NapF|nr:4Fe-4S dicluster domain-containing protein [Desulfovibrio sp.]
MACKRTSLSRRTFLQIGGAGIAAAGLTAIAASTGEAAPPRPPGALEEGAFLARCARCMRCVDACIPLALRPGGWLDGGRNLGTPVLDPAKCIFCMECVRTCPTGALEKIPKAEVDIGEIVIVQDVCLAWRKTRRCDICFKACPAKAITMQDRRFPVLSKPEKCNGCGICVRRCPEAGSILMTDKGANRPAPPPGHLLTHLEDRVGPYEIAPPPWSQWFQNRLLTLAQHFGLASR